MPKKINNNNNLNPHLIPYTYLLPTDSKWITDIHIKQRTIKVLDKNIAQNLHNLNAKQSVFRPDTKIGSIKEISINWTLSKL